MASSSGGQIIILVSFISRNQRLIHDDLPRTSDPALTSNLTVHMHIWECVAHHGRQGESMTIRLMLGFPCMFCKRLLSVTHKSSREFQDTDRARLAF
jgi:hypothetical protein